MGFDVGFCVGECLRQEQYIVSHTNRCFGAANVHTRDFKDYCPILIKIVYLCDNSQSSSSKKISSD